MASSGRREAPSTSATTAARSWAGAGDWLVILLRVMFTIHPLS